MGYTAVGLSEFLLLGPASDREWRGSTKLTDGMSKTMKTEIRPEADGTGNVLEGFGAGIIDALEKEQQRLKKNAEGEAARIVAEAKQLAEEHQQPGRREGGPGSHRENQARSGTDTCRGQRRISENHR